MPIKKVVNNGILYFADTETGEISPLMAFNDFCAASIAHDLTGVTIKFGSGWLHSDYKFSARDAYLICLKAGVDIFYVPNNFRRMHGYKVRRRSLRKRRTMKALKAQ